MIKEDQKALNRLYMILDAMLIFLSFALSYFVRFTLFPPKTGAWYPFSGYSKFLLALIP
ncbi:MAG: undecaprenyl-phosphate glucose phosphotransferase, partial [Lachnospiraceae bacterium]|nr:undecaprenyl-phosphate glucose phosphotransferase [Lachnospiraceae bacterium]